MQSLCYSFSFNSFAEYDSLSWSLWSFWTWTISFQVSIALNVSIEMPVLFWQTWLFKWLHLSLLKFSPDLLFKSLDVNILSIICYEEFLYLAYLLFLCFMFQAGNSFLLIKKMNLIWLKVFSKLEWRHYSTSMTVMQRFGL